MSYKEYFIQKVIPAYFMLVTFLVIFICVCGMIMEPETRFGYDAFLSPLIYAVIGTIPHMLGYSRKELTIRQTFIKSVANFILLTVLILGFSFYMNVIKKWQEGVAVFLGVCVIYALISWMLWKMESTTARRLTEALSELKEKE